MVRIHPVYTGPVRNWNGMVPYGHPVVLQHGCSHINVDIFLNFKNSCTFHINEYIQRKPHGAFEMRVYKIETIL